MTTSPVEKLSAEFGKYIELEQKYKEIETGIAKRVVSSICFLIIAPFLLTGYFYSGIQGIGIFFVISLFVLLVGYGIYHHKTAILNVEKKQERRNKILNCLSFVVGTQVEEANQIRDKLEKDRESLIQNLKSEDYSGFFNDLYSFIETKDLNDDRAMLDKIEKVSTLYHRKFYSVLFHELKMNVCLWNKVINDEKIKQLKNH